MLPSSIELTQDDRRVLVDIGFIALSAGLTSRALAIFRGVQVAKPSEEAGFIGEALVHLGQGDPKRAVDILQALSPSDAATLFLGIALARLGDKTEARELLLSVINTPGGSMHGPAAEAALAELG